MIPRSKEAASIADRLMAEEPALVVLAGPNGAGKTTFVATFLHSLDFPFINADVIAKQLWPSQPDGVAYEAAKIADGMRRSLLATGASFIMETVFSDREGSKLQFLRDAQKSGYTVCLVFIGLGSSHLALARVLERTEEGGHDVPDEKVVNRFPRTHENLRDALAFVDHAFIFDNSSSYTPYRFIAEMESGRVIRSGRYQPRWWKTIRQAPRE